MKLHILAIGVHPDDVELGCMGTLIKHINKGQKVGVLDLTEGELGSRGSVESRYTEAADSAALAGLSVRKNLKMQDGFFENNKGNKLAIIQVIRQYQPDIVLANALHDRHPDHGRASSLIEDACFLSGLTKIETWLDEQPQEAWRPARVFHYVQDRFIHPSFIVDISDTFEKKMACIQCFKTQFFHSGSKDIEPVTYISQPGFLEKIEARALLLGQRIGAKYGEGYNSAADMGINDLDALLYPKLS